MVRATTKIDKTTTVASIETGAYKYRWVTLGVLSFSLLLLVMGNTSLNVALPVVGKDLHASISQLQWFVDAYAIVVAGLLFVAGAIGDRYGRKMILQTGLFIFAATSAYAGLMADTPLELIIGRAAMGAGAAMMMPATLSILTHIFPRNERPKAIAIWSGVVAAGAVLGPIVAGVILQHHSWQLILSMNVPLAAIAFLAGSKLIPHTANSKASIDILGGVLSTVSIASLVYAVIEAPTHGWLAFSTLSLMGFGLVMAAVFVWWERRVEHPLLDVRLFKRSDFGVSSLSLTLVFFALNGLLFSLFLLMQLIYGYSPLSSAIRFIPIAVTLGVSSALAPGLTKRLGANKATALGLLITAAGFIVIASLPVTPDFARLIAGMIITAFGMGIVMTTATDLLMASVPLSRTGMGSAMNDFTREMGGALGVAVLGSILASQYRAKLGQHLAHIPVTLHAATTESLGGALQTAQSIGGKIGLELTSTAKTAWMYGYEYSLLIGTAVIVCAAIFAYFGLPSRDRYGDKS
jgi:EmrB/QacA subfamily drug resistance transporter